MSTRSGRRIHGSFHENIEKHEDELLVKTDKKPRSRRLKEKDSAIVPKSKKRNNYVSYPIDDEVGDGTLQSKDNQMTLQELDLNVSTKTESADNDTVKIVRHTRRTKKISENLSEDVPLVVENGKNDKKSKRNKINKDSSQTEVNENMYPLAVPKKSKKKKGKKVNSFTEVVITTEELEDVNKSAGSVDSFHSAAASPLKESLKADVIKPNGSFTKSPRRGTKRMKTESCEDIENACLNEAPNHTSKKVKLSNSDKSLETTRLLRSGDTCTSPKEKDAPFDKSNVSLTINGTFEKVIRRSSIKNSTFDKIDTPKKTIKKTNSISEKNNTPTPKKQVKTAEEHSTTKRRSSRTSIVPVTQTEIVMKSTFEKVDLVQASNNGPLSSSKKSRQSALNSTFDKLNDSKLSGLNTTFEKNKDQRQSTLNTTFEKSKSSSTPSKLNNTFDKNRKSRQSLNNTFEKAKDSTSTLNSTYEKPQPALNTTFEKSDDSTHSKLNSTFDKETKLNSTYDKPEDKSESSKSSLISSDGASNVTLDKSDDNSRISITSDDSRTENIVNTTPVLIESSMDESRVTEPTPTKSDEETTKVQVSATPLKREGTFTKEGPEVVMSPRSKGSTTPAKRMSLPSPGSTPFPFSKSSQKERSLLNVTRSVERSSLAEPPRARVMFCSPVNPPAALAHQRRKVIKSSMKGSNKSFVFEEAEPSAVPRAGGAGRKRSYTAGEAEAARSKRSRRDDPARVRTCSATVKPSVPTPSKKAGTPKPPEARAVRTRLPDFAALHEREFARMESLQQGQLRRARRARLLLTPARRAAVTAVTADTAVTGNTSPLDKAAASEPVKAATVKEAVKAPEPVKAAIAKETVKESCKKPVTAAPTLMSLRPGYTRFGFKMHLDSNPFAAPRTDAKPRDNKPNALVTRQPSQPSLAGATCSRREAAKQTVMREKSFTSLSERRSVTRKENRSVIKGVRTNRRFELQMQMRNINS